MPSEILRQEIRSLAMRAAALDLAAYFISIPVLGVTLSFALGLLLGTAVLIVTLLLLKYSVLRMEEDAKRAGVTSQRRYLLLYAARLGIFGAAFAAALTVPEWLHPAAVAIPMLFPRLIYTAGALFSGFYSPKKRGEK